MNLYQVLGAAIAESVQSVAGAFDLFGAGHPVSATTHGPVGWHQQFSAASLDERRARRTADALYRGATVRL